MKHAAQIHGGYAQHTVPPPFYFELSRYTTVRLLLLFFACCMPLQRSQVKHTVLV